MHCGFRFMVFTCEGRDSSSCMHNYLNANADQHATDNWLNCKNDTLRMSTAARLSILLQSWLWASFRCRPSTSTRNAFSAQVGTLPGQGHRAHQLGPSELCRCPQGEASFFLRCFRSVVYLLCPWFCWPSKRGRGRSCSRERSQGQQRRSSRPE